MSKESNDFTNEQSTETYSNNSSSPDSVKPTKMTIYNSNQPSSETIQNNSEEQTSSDSEANLKQENKKSLTEDLDDDEVFGFKVPEVDWENLEAKLKEAQIEINTQNQRTLYQNNERDEIRRKLAIVSSSSSISASSFGEQNGSSRPNGENPLMSDYLRKSSMAKTNYLGQNMQICFMNEIQDDDDYDSYSDEDLSNNSSDLKTKQTQSGNANHHISNLPVFSFKKDSSCDDLLSKHITLQNETKEALLNVPANVRLQLQSQEVVQKKASPIADIVGLKTYGQERLTRGHIVDMNIGQLQVIANDLFNQIENINENLTTFLTERDDLSMQQDSFLIDIEDLSKRIQEYALQLKSPPDENSFTSTNQNNASTTSEKLKNTSLPMFNKSKLTQLNNMLASSKSSLTNKLYSFTKKK